MRKLIAWTLLLSLYIGFVAPLARAEAQIVNRRIAELNLAIPDGLIFKLSDGNETAQGREKSGPVASQQIDDSGAVLKRLPPIKSDKDDTSDFAKRAGTKPAPKTGNRIPVKFPSPAEGAQAGRPSNQSLDVLRFSPEGEVGLAPDLSVTFSQPMVAVTSQEEAATVVPVELAPSVEGRWRWVGTKTLMFDTDKRFPMATKFSARVPAGTKSANGLSLAKDVTWAFTTPPPKVEQMYPNGQIVKRDALMYLVFDQAITPEAVLSKLSVTGGARRLNIRLATDEELSREGYASVFKQDHAGRWMAFRAVNADGSTQDALPAASTITVNVGRGTPSAEGPLTTTKAQTFSFSTFSALKFQQAVCGSEGNKECSPFEGWYLKFNNTIDSSKFDAKMVTIEPAIEGIKIFPSGSNIYIQGYKKGKTTYKIIIDSALTDIFGQTLGKTATASIRVDSAPTTFYAQGGSMIVLDTAASKSLSVYSTNHDAAKVQIYKVAPSDWRQFQEYLRRQNYDDATPRPTMPGRLVLDKTVRIASKPDEMVETRIDLSHALDSGLGHVIVVAEPTVRRDKYDRTRVVTWIQSTQIGLDAFVDNGELVGFATDLRTGRPLSGVSLSIKPNGVGGGERAAVESPEKGYFERAWDWLTGLRASGPSDQTLAIEGDGSSSATENVETAQTDTTGASGVLRLPLPASMSQGEQNYLLASRGRDTAFLPENTDYYWNQNGSWYQKPSTDSLRWFVFDDRKMYKPKEEVSVKGYIRKIKGGELGDVEGLGGAALTYTWAAKDARDADIASGTTTTNPFGAFDFKFALSDTLNLGDARIEFTEQGSTAVSHTHSFSVQEFRRPEFEVTAKVKTPAPHFVKESAMLSVDAKYYAGGGLANAETNWTLTATPTNYTPPNRDEYTFGTWTPWWRVYDHDGYSGRGHYGVGQMQNFKGVTDAAGRHLLKIDFESVKPARPYALSASASVQDVNRQTWAGQTSLLVHPANLYVGIKTPRTFVQKGDSIVVDSIVTDLDGNLVVNRDVEVTAILKDWVFDKGAWKETIVDEQRCAVRSSESAQRCSFVAKAGGRYTITATVVDDRERPNESQFTVWVAGGKTPPKRNVEQEQAEIIPSKKDYAPGDVAELLVMAPFTPAEGVLTLRREGVVKVERFSMQDSSITLKIPLDEEYLPNITAQVDLVGSAPRMNDKGEVDPKAATRPAFATGKIDLPISTASRKLTVTAEPLEKTLIPGGSTKVNVAVKDHLGEPVADSEVAIVVVDESVLALSRYSIADPLVTFYSLRPDGTVDYHSRRDVLLGNPEDAKNSPPSPPESSKEAVSVDGMDAAITSRQISALVTLAPGTIATTKKSGGRLDDAEAASANQQDPAIALRQNFNALALWSPKVRTDSSGRASIDVKLPDNLTRYRITAVAVDTGKRFGKTESDITAKQPLMVRPSAPRFLNFGDTAEVPVVIQNQTDKDMTVDVAMRASNANLEGGNPSGSEGAQAAGKRVLVKANDRAEVRFPVSTVKAGTARFQFAASSGSYSDAAEISLPVWTPATTEAFATYGTTDQNGAMFQPIQAPKDVYPQFGGLEVTTSSTQLQELTDAYIYLANYPYGCSEQIASRMISTAALRDVLSAFKSRDMPSPQVLARQFESDIAVLKSRQREDGSFGLWKRERERYEYPFLTIHVAHALALAKAKGYKVPDEMLNRTKSYLDSIEKHFDEWHKSAQVRWTISAYALYIRDMMGDKDARKAKKILAEANIEKLNLEAMGWILSVLADDKGSTAEVEAITLFLMNRTTETASTANFVTNYGDGAWLIMYSNRRRDGILLEALIKAQGRSASDGSGVASFGDLIPKIVRGLLAHRSKGHWGSTQENVFILLALDKYFAAYEGITPDFVTRVWLGDAYAGEQTFKGRSVDSNQLDIPMSYLIDQGVASNLILDRQGVGRLYYRIGMKYAPRNLKLEPADYGFTVLRNYEAIDDKDDVKQNTDGSWTIKSGARVRVRLTMVAQARRYHVALVDSLPAGLEILNPELATTEVIPRDQSTNRIDPVSTRFGGLSLWWRTHWFDHQNFRDERAEAFSALLYEGVYNYTYIARATTPGKFVAPPAKAEEMYMPETFGRTGTDFVTVK